jgi:hypothetical protein
MLDSVPVDGLALTIAPAETARSSRRSGAVDAQRLRVDRPGGAQDTGRRAARPMPRRRPENGVPRVREDWLGGPLVLQDVSVRWQTRKAACRRPCPAWTWFGRRW